MKTIVSSPCDSNDLLMNIITPGTSPVKEHDSARYHVTGGRDVCRPRNFGKEVPVSESEEDTSDCESTEEGIFPLDYGDLDLEQIENN